MCATFDVGQHQTPKPWDAECSLFRRCDQAMPSQPHASRLDPSCVVFSVIILHVPPHPGQGRYAECGQLVSVHVMELALDYARDIRWQNEGSPHILAGRSVGQ